MERPSEYTMFEIRKEAKSLESTIRRKHKGTRIYFDSPVLSVSECGTSIRIGYRLASNIEDQHYTASAL